MLHITPDQFESLVADALDAVPEEALERLENVVFLIEDRPEDGSDLLGMYEGISLTERSFYGYGNMPDRIVLFRENLVAACRDEEELRREIHITLMHEIAHCYGIPEERLHELGWG
ncbi:metallopeptidase family protein [Rothia sp. AR01]|uniref:Metallopeptidase family protein n=1 Tax=Rothia santali TaxID=2949643 RepID=A0A9X2HCK3_9MICC|nr:metallopeptidase family protein [Rothia santali]MCP3426861.1 metallopeptidase family protein [Rothia santali]